MMSENNLYFILTRKPEHRKHISAGGICYTKKSTHRLETEIRPSCLWKKMTVFFLGTQTTLSYEIEVSELEELSKEEAELLQALPDDAERLKWFGQRDSLRAAMELTEGIVVTVDEAGVQLRGIIRYIGRLTEPTYLSPISGRFFGIELQVGL